jgi:hypothetical protein
LLWGQSGVGKSTFVGSLVSTLLDPGKQEFLGYPILQRPKRLLILTTDGGEHFAMARRLEACLAEIDAMDAVYIESWRERDWLSDAVDLSGLVGSDVGFVIIDHFQGILSGNSSVNSDGDVRRYFQFADRVVDLGVPVLFVHHASEKAIHGDGARTPIGSSLFVSLPRAVVQLREANECVVVSSRPNDAAPSQVAYQVAREGPRASLSVVALPKAATEAKREAQTKARAHAAEQFKDLLVMAAQQCSPPGITIKEGGQILHTHGLAMSPNAGETQIKRKQNQLPEGTIRFVRGPQRTYTAAP